MAIQVTLCDDPAKVLADAGSFLASEPVFHNIILTLLHSRITYPEPGRYWIARQGEQVWGVVLQSPMSYPATITPMSAEVAAAMVDGIVDSGVALPGVNGEAAAAARFAGQWTERTKSAAVPVLGMRLYELKDLHELNPVNGTLRAATAGDRDLAIDWLHQFQVEIGEQHADLSALVDQWLPGGHIWIWDDHGPVSIAVTRGAVERVVRIAPVYTPAGYRNRGYAGACVCAVAKRIRQHGNRAILYTDLANPTSNSIYRRIGFQAVAEALRYRFD